MLKKRTFGLIFLILNAVLIESVLRLFNYIYPTSVFYREDYNQYRGKPNSDNFGFKLNSGGFKDVEYPVEKPIGAYRIVGIGDSFTFGVAPYPYNFLTLLEESLNTLPSLQPVEVINMGISSTEPPHYLSLIQDEASGLAPDMILLSFFVGNDISGSSRDSRRRKVLTYSYLASALYYIYKVTTSLGTDKIVKTYGEGYIYCDTCGYMKPADYLSLEAEHSYLFQKDNVLFKRHLKDTFFYLKKIKNLCDRQNIKLVVGIIPDEVQVNRQLQREVISHLKMSPDAWDNAQPNRMLRSELKKMGVPVIDLLDVFLQGTSATTSTYLPRDTHWNIKGNRVAAGALAGRLPELLAKRENWRLWHFFTTFAPQFRFIPGDLTKSL